MKYKKPNQKSEKKKLREKIGKLHFEILKLERGARSEISGNVRSDLGRFHILPVGRYPKLEFHSQNVLLALWFGEHFEHHHCNEENENWQKCHRAIVKLRGENYIQELRVLHEIQPKHDMTYLQMLHDAFKQELKKLKEKK